MEGDRHVDEKQGGEAAITDSSKKQQTGLSEGTLFRASKPCRVAGLRLGSRAVELLEKHPHEVKVAIDDNGMLSALLVGSERIPLVTTQEPEPKNAILCRIDGDDLTAVGPFFQRAHSDLKGGGRAARPGAAALAAEEASASKKKLKKLTVDELPPARRLEGEQSAPKRRTRAAPVAGALLPTPPPTAATLNGRPLPGEQRQRRRQSRLTFDHKEPWVECTVEGLRVSGQHIHVFFGAGVIIPDNGIWWLPGADCIDRKDSCTIYVRVQNMDQVRFCVEKSGETIAGICMEILHASPESVSAVENFGLPLRMDLTVAMALDLFTKAIPDHIMTKALAVWTKVVPTWLKSGQDLCKERDFQMFHNGFFQQIDHVTLALSVLRVPPHRPDLLESDLAYAISSLNTLRNGLRSIMVTIRSRTLETSASMRSVYT